jgi:hypothetical protein
MDAEETAPEMMEDDVGDMEMMDDGTPAGGPAETPAGGAETPAGGAETPAGGAETPAGETPAEEAPLPAGDEEGDGAEEDFPPLPDPWAGPGRRAS